MNQTTTLDIMDATGPDSGTELARLRLENQRLRAQLTQRQPVPPCDRQSLIVRGVWVSLTPRQREVMALVAQGMTHQQIAEALGVAPATVHAHILHVRNRLGCNRSVQAVGWLVKAGLVGA